MKNRLNSLIFTLLAAIMLLASPLEVSAAEKASAAVEVNDNNVKLSITAPEVNTALLGIVIENVSTGDTVFMEQDSLKEGKLTVTTKLSKGEYKAVISNNSINIVTEKFAVTKAAGEEEKEAQNADAGAIGGIIPKTGGAVDFSLLLIIGTAIIAAGLIIRFRRIK
jgi:LPXTG-motif cell wall-anchored protein